MDALCFAADLMQCESDVERKRKKSAKRMANETKECDSDGLSDHFNPPIMRVSSPWARFAFMALSAFWTAAGWSILLEGGFYKSYKYSKETTYVDGPSAVVMAYLFLLLATIAAAIVLQSIGARRSAFIGLIVIILGSPGLFLLRSVA
jgi:hypothetical protein